MSAERGPGPSIAVATPRASVGSFEASSFRASAIGTGLGRLEGFRATPSAISRDTIRSGSRGLDSFATIARPSIKRESPSFGNPTKVRDGDPLAGVKLFQIEAPVPRFGTVSHERSLNPFRDTVDHTPKQNIAKEDPLREVHVDWIPQPKRGFGAVEFTPSVDNAKPNKTTIEPIIQTVEVKLASRTKKMDSPRVTTPVFLYPRVTEIPFSPGPAGKPETRPEEEIAPQVEVKKVPTPEPQSTPVFVVLDGTPSAPLRHTRPPRLEVYPRSAIEVRTLPVPNPAEQVQKTATAEQQQIQDLAELIEVRAAIATLPTKEEEEKKKQMAYFLQNETALVAKRRDPNEAFQEGETIIYRKDLNEMMFRRIRIIMTYLKLLQGKNQADEIVTGRQFISKLTPGRGDLADKVQVKDGEDTQMRREIAATIGDDPIDNIIEIAHRKSEENPSVEMKRVKSKENRIILVDVEDRHIHTTLKGESIPDPLAA